MRARAAHQQALALRVPRGALSHQIIFTINVIAVFARGAAAHTPRRERAHRAAHTNIIIIIRVRGIMCAALCGW